MQPDDIDRPDGSGIEISFQCPCGQRGDIDIHIGGDVAFTCGGCGEPYEIKTLAVARSDEPRDTGEPADRGCLIIPESWAHAATAMSDEEAAMFLRGDLGDGLLPAILVDPFE